QTGLSSGNFNIPFEYFIANGTSQNFSKQYSEVGINSLFTSVNVDYKNIVFLNFTGRNDWFSTLDPSRNNLFYPSVGASFLFSEILATKPAWLNYGKLRGSWAQVGGDAPNAYALNQTYTAQSVPYNGHTLLTVTSGTLPTALTPYTSTTSEVGLE